MKFSKTKKLRIGTRPSPLALKQVEEVIRIFGIKCFEIKTYNSTSDRDKKTPISEVEGSDFFTDTLDRALLQNEIDIAVHSAKDIPDVLAPGLIVAAVTSSIDCTDALVSKGNLKLTELPLNARLGTSSQRRKEQLKKFRQDFIAA